MRGGRGWLLAFTFLIGATALCTNGSAAEKPTPTPTPEQDLAALAKTLRIHPDASQSEDGGVHITNQTLVETEGSGSITREGAKPETFAVAKSTAPVDSQANESSASLSSEDNNVLSWQQRYRELLVQQKQTEEHLRTLAKELPELWRRFYYEDDPSLRDGIIRNKLDRALQQHELLVEGKKRADGDLIDFLVEAREAGALPGWFRETSRNLND